MKFFLSQKYLLLFIRINHFSLSMQIKKNQSKCLCNCIRWNEMHYNNIVMHKKLIILFLMVEAFIRYGLQ
ncbi:Uncharacterised protein [Escherichia coli]|nr:Uncharacterised protein [Escherichia coli]